MTNVLEYLEASARRLPDKTAVSDPQSALSYRALWQDARRIGSALLPHAAPRQPVAVCMEKSVMALTAMMGIVYAGCFYVFIDPGQPAARFLQILSVCRPACLLTDKPEGLPAAPGVPVLRPAELLTQPENAPALAAVRAQALDIDPLYCNFTSGSTGVPKGVRVCHRSVLDFSAASRSCFRSAKTTCSQIRRPLISTSRSSISIPPSKQARGSCWCRGNIFLS